MHKGWIAGGGVATIAALALLTNGGSSGQKPTVQLAAAGVPSRPDMSDCLVDGAGLQGAVESGFRHKVIAVAAHAAVACNSAASTFRARAAAALQPRERKTQDRLAAAAGMLGEGYGRVSYGADNYAPRETMRGLQLIRQGMSVWSTEVDRVLPKAAHRNRHHAHKSSAG